MNSSPKNRDENKKLTFPLIGSIINVQAYKYNGELYRQWNGVKVLRNTPKHYVLLMYKTKVTEIHEKYWIYREYVLWFMPKNSMYNALILLKPRQNYIYVNMASRPIYEDNTIKFVDFDLDVKCYPTKSLTIVDRDEFRENTKKYHYSNKLIQEIYDNLQEVVEKYNRFEYFFNEEVIDYYLELAKKDKSVQPNFRKTKYNKRNYSSETAFEDFTKKMS